MTINSGQLNQCAIYYNMNTFEKPRLKALTQFTLSDFSTVAAYVATDYHTVNLLELPPEKIVLINLLNTIDAIDATQADKAIESASYIRAGYSAVLQYLPRLTLIDYIKLLVDSAGASTVDTPLSENPQEAPAILANLIDKLTAETASKSLRIKQFEAEQRARLRARAERKASLTERELIERRKQRVKQVQAQKTNLKMFIKALSVSTDEATFSQKVLKVAELIDSDLDL